MKQPNDLGNPEEEKSSDKQHQERCFFHSKQRVIIPEKKDCERRMQSDHFLDKATKELREAPKRDLEPVVFNL